MLTINGVEHSWIWLLVITAPYFLGWYFIATKVAEYTEKLFHLGMKRYLGEEKYRIYFGS